MWPSVFAVLSLFGICSQGLITAQNIGVRNTYLKKLPNENKVKNNNWFNSAASNNGVQPTVVFPNYKPDEISFDPGYNEFFGLSRMTPILKPNLYFIPPTNDAYYRNGQPPFGNILKGIENIPVQNRNQKYPTHSYYDPLYDVFGVCSRAKTPAYPAVENKRAEIIDKQPYELYNFHSTPNEPYYSPKLTDEEYGPIEQENIDDKYNRFLNNDKREHLYIGNKKFMSNNYHEIRPEPAESFPDRLIKNTTPHYQNFNIDNQNNNRAIIRQIWHELNPLSDGENPIRTTTTVNPVTMQEFLGSDYVTKSSLSSRDQDGYSKESDNLKTKIIPDLSLIKNQNLSIHKAIQDARRIVDHLLLLDTIDNNRKPKLLLPTIRNPIMKIPFPASTTPKLKLSRRHPITKHQKITTDNNLTQNLDLSDTEFENNNDNMYNIDIPKYRKNHLPPVTHYNRKEHFTDLVTGKNSALLK